MAAGERGERVKAARKGLFRSSPEVPIPASLPSPCLFLAVPGRAAHAGRVVAESVPEQPAPLPLAVDLDGTLLRTDLLWEGLAGLLKRTPWLFLLLPFWWMRGRAYLKARLAAAVPLDIATLPVSETFLAWLREQHAAGRGLWLVTAADQQLAGAVAAHFGFFSGILASDGATNLKGRTKRDVLVARFGARGFAYAGDSHVDLPVWAEAGEIIVVNARPAVTAAARRLGRPVRFFAPTRPRLRTVLKALRVHQWAKNLLLLVPAVTAHRWDELDSLPLLLVAFAAFAATASAVYLLNDLADLAADRRHPSKHRRPFASGSLPLSFGFVLAPSLFLLGGACALVLPAAFGLNLAAYVLLTWAYTLRLRSLAIVDVVVLALLYLLRLSAGAAALGVPLSFWLIAFAIFVFLSLGLLKRAVELRLQPDTEGGGAARVGGRGYQAEDRLVVGHLGTAAGYTSALVLALYVHSPDVAELYARPAALWGACLVHVWWISRIWLLALRGEVDEDPVIFALKDGPSWLAGLALGLLVLLAQPL